MKRFLVILVVALTCMSVWAVQKTTYVFAQRDTCSLQMDVYMPDDTLQTHPCVFFVFGGGFKMGQRDTPSAVTYMENLAKQGMVGVAIDYRLGLKGVESTSLIELAKLMENAVNVGVEDTYDAINYVLNNAQELKINPSQIVLSGSSAGAIISLQCDYYLQNKHPLSQKLPPDFCLGGVVSFAGAIAAFNGKVTYQNPPAPTFFLHGTKDKLVVYNKLMVFGKGMFGSNALAKQFDKNGWPYQFYRFKNFGHEIAVIGYKEHAKAVVDFVQRFVVEKQPLQIDGTWAEKGIEKPLMDIDPAGLYGKTDVKLSVSPQILERIR
ncbi:MAG: alpha/beta hydrolase [Paludibacteraceae bacterium]|nr:alpha/beta hydrolase [Paludibacteraceae bacterium]